jgi:O-antigen/teichoic acid export membrane protein
MNEKVKILKNTGWLILDKGLILIVSLFVTVIVARYLGPEKFGMLSYCFAVIGLLSGIASLGWDRIIIKDMTDSDVRIKEILETQYFLKLIGAICVLIFALIIIKITKPKDVISLIVVITLSVAGILAAVNVKELFFLAKLRSNVVSQIKIISILIGATLKLSVVMFGGDIIDLAVVALLEVLIIAIGLTWLYVRRTGNLLIPTFHTKYGIELIKKGWPLLVALQLDIMAQKIYGVALEGYMNESDYGQLMLAIRIIEIPCMLIYVSVMSFLPILTKLKYTNNLEYDRISVYVTEIATLFGLISWIFMILFSHKIILYLFGSQFEDSASILVGMWGAVLLQANAIFRAHHLTITDSVKTLMWGNLFSMIMTVPLAIIFIYQWGTLAVGWAFSITIFFSYFASGITSREGRVIMSIQLRSVKFKYTREKCLSMVASTF